MLPIVNKPLIQYGVEEAMQAGMTKIGIVKGRGKRALEDHFPQKGATSVRWFRRASDQGLAIAQTNLGWMYRFGRGVRQDHEEAAHWYRLAADQGFSVTQYHLGLMYENGWGVPQDRVESAIWYRKAAEQGVGS